MFSFSFLLFLLTMMLAKHMMLSLLFIEISYLTILLQLSFSGSPMFYPLLGLVSVFSALAISLVFSDLKSKAVDSSFSTLAAL